MVEFLSVERELLKPFKHNPYLLNIAEQEFRTNVFTATVSAHFDPEPSERPNMKHLRLEMPLPANFVAIDASDVGEVGTKQVDLLKMLPSLYPNNLQSITISLCRFDYFLGTASTSAFSQRYEIMKSTHMREAAYLLRSYVQALQAYASPHLWVERLEFEQKAPEDTSTHKQEPVEMTFKCRELDEVITEALKIPAMMITP
ncbi:hypothetical protein LTR85_007157 [Meristemomyces frigidus]|nr:hypothetical protein LTR85_007157 [Meristemomyces frigidus]